MSVDELNWEELWRTPETPAPTLNGATHPVDGSGEPYALAALRGECAAVSAAAVGARNATLNTAAFRMGRHVGAGTIAPDVVRQALRDAARATGLPDDEIELVLRSNDNGGLAQGQARPRVPTPLTPVPEPHVLDAPDLPPDREEAFWAARPLLTLLHDFARARRVSPWAVLGVALCRVVTAVPPHHVLPAVVGGQASLNMFVGLVGPSGSGKGAAEQVAAEAMRVGLIECHKTGSGEGIAHGYMRRERGEVVQHTTAVLFSVPEIDTLTALGGRQGATLLPELRSAWSGERLGFGYADPAKRLPVPAHRYRLCLVAGVQPARASGLLDDADAGTPQRFLWLPSTDPEAPDVAPPCPEPFEWEAPTMADTRPFATPSGRVELRVCERAVDVIVVSALERHRGSVDALDGHALLCRLKTAAALALADGRLEVGDEDWDLAGVVSEKSAATRALVAQTLAAANRDRNLSRAEAEATRTLRISERVDEAAVKRTSRSLVRTLRRVDEPTPHNLLRKSLASKDRPHFEEALEHLVSVGQVIVEQDEYRGRNRTVYRIEEGN